MAIRIVLADDNYLLREGAGTRAFGRLSSCARRARKPGSWSSCQRAIHAGDWLVKLLVVALIVSVWQ